LGWNRTLNSSRSFLFLAIWTFWLCCRHFLFLLPFPCFFNFSSSMCTLSRSTLSTLISRSPLGSGCTLSIPLSSSSPLSNGCTSRSWLCCNNPLSSGCTLISWLFCISPVSNWCTLRSPLSFSRLLWWPFTWCRI